MRKILQIIIFSFIVGNIFFTNDSNFENKELNFQLREKDVNFLVHPSLNSANVTIDGNTQLALHALSGEGTENSPYILANYNLNNITESYGIEISNTNKHFILENVTVDGSSTCWGGIRLVNVTYGNIRNNTIQNCYMGIRVEISYNISINENFAINNSRYGFLLKYSDDLTLNNNSALITGEVGFCLDSNFECNYNFTNNIANHNILDGFKLDNSRKSKNNIINNTANYNGRNGFSSSFSSFYTSDSNIYYNIANYNSKNGFSFLVSNSSFAYNTANNNSESGFYITSSENNTIYNNTAYGNDDGINLHYNSNNNTIFNNSLYYNRDGITLYESNINNITNNKVMKNNIDGIFLSQSNNNSFNNNILCNNTTGINLDSDSYYNSIFNNTVSYNSEGFMLDNVRYNIIIKNTISYNRNFGLLCSITSRNNTISYNYFITNNYEDFGGFSQIFDDGTDNQIQYNYWDDHTNIDSNDDGFADDPYNIDGEANNFDESPIIPNDIGQIIPEQNYSVLLLILIIFCVITVNKKK